jgi:hypothetical protein
MTAPDARTRAVIDLIQREEAAQEAQRRRQTESDAALARQLASRQQGSDGGADGDSDVIYLSPRQPDDGAGQVSTSGNNAARVVPSALAEQCNRASPGDPVGGATFANHARNFVAHAAKGRVCL